MSQFYIICISSGLPRDFGSVEKGGWGGYLDLESHLLCSAIIYYMKTKLDIDTINIVGGWVGRWCWVASSAGRPTTLAYGRAGACCACSRCRTGGLFFFCFFFHPVDHIFLL